MSKKWNIFLIIIATVLFVWGIVLTNKPIAFEEKYKSEWSATSAPIELQFYECGIVKVNSTSRFYEQQENTRGDRIIKISYDEFKIVNFYKLEYTRWDVESQSDKTTYLTCSSILSKVIVLFVIDIALIVFIVYKTIKQRKNSISKKENNN